MGKKAIIIGAGPAGLTAAYELLKRTDIIPIILEKSGDIGGISKTINYKGNRMDMGPHRFFSKSDRVMNWWLNIMPLQDSTEEKITIKYQNKSHEITSQVHPRVSDDEKNTHHQDEKVMLLIKRLTRIYFLRKFFAYPIQLSLDTLRTLGFIRTIKILFSFFGVRLFPRKPEKSLEDFIINKFGNQLYLLFFKDYTEKVWGVPCNEISAEWGAQRIKGVSLSKAISQAIKSLRNKKKGKNDFSQKEIETSLIEQFLYPKHGAGSLWEEVARQVQEMGGVVILNQQVQKIHFEKVIGNYPSLSGKVTGVTTINSETGQTGFYTGDYFFSSMPVQELIAAMDHEESIVPQDVKEVAVGLQYRDFINVGILLKQLSRPTAKGGYEKIELKDNWIYIQERDVKVGRLMIYNNWGGGMINDPNNTWIGMEYFSNKTDAFWAQSDESIQRIAIEELEKMGLACVEDVLDITVRRMEKTYPAYFGTYDKFDKIKDYVNQFDNLFLVGRNGMHKYNNSDHSMLTAMVAVDNICEGVITKANIWAINTEQEYHEEKLPASCGTEINQKDQAAISEPDSADILPSFKEYLFKTRRNKMILRIAAIAIVIQFVVFKYFYPFASFIHGDSFNYLETAIMNLDINTYMVGYARFLRIFSVFSYSDTALVAFQYLFIQFSALFFLFTLFYFYRPGKAVQILLLCFMVLNPLFLHMGNMVSSDALFLALSLTWISLLVWIIHKPSKRLLVLHGFVMFVAFTVRYNGMIYPMIAGMAFMMSRISIRTKIAGMALGVVPIVLFVIYTASKYQALTGTWQYSPFAGWQWTNNAMYAYRYVDSADRKPVPSRFRKLDNMIRTYFDSTRDVKKHPQEGWMASTAYMWSSSLPLFKYMDWKFSKDSTADEKKKWPSMGPVYADYGIWLIKHYPLHFARYFIWPNANKYYAPPVEFLEEYNSGKDSVTLMAQMWFRYKSKKVTTRMNTLKVTALDFYPILSGVINVVMLCCLTCFVILNGLRQRALFRKGIILGGAVWIINAGFTISASSAALRFQSFPILLATTFAVLLIDWMCKMAVKPGLTEISNKS